MAVYGVQRFRSDMHRTELNDPAAIENQTMARRSFVIASSALALAGFVGASDLGVVVSRTPYQFPFETYQDWLKFMDDAPDPAWRANSMQALIPQVTFERYRNHDGIRIDKLVYLSDGLQINGYVIAPAAKAKPMPVILYAHGGVAQWGRITFFDLLELSRLASQGYVVIASALRGEGGSEGAPNLGAGDRDDMLRLLDVAAEIEGADTSRVGLLGFSRGGGLGYRVLAASDRFKAAVLVAAPSNLVDSPRREEFDTHVYPGIVDDYETDKERALQALSAAYWPERLPKSTPILLVHGTGDKRVRVSNSRTMAGHLTRLGHPHELMLIDEGSHTLIEHWPQVRTAIDGWFGANL